MSISGLAALLQLQSPAFPTTTTTTTTTSFTVSFGKSRGHFTFTGSVSATRLHSHSSSSSSPTRTQVFATQDHKPPSQSSRLAVVTGANRGIGFEIARQLALDGVTVILTSRDDKRGTDALHSLHNDHNLSNVLSHRLDVCDPISVASLAMFIETRFGKLDILVNNAGASGLAVDVEGLRALNIDPLTWVSGKAVDMIKEVITHPYDEAVRCLDTNYYGVKWVTEALLPFLKLSTYGARIVNVSSLRSELKRMPNEELRKELSNIDRLDEKKLEELISTFLDDFKNGRHEAAGWPNMLPAYSVSKMVLNAYTRVLARRYPDMCINCVGPGFVNTELNWNTGVLTPEEGAKGPVMLALLPNGGPTGSYFDQTVLAEAW